MQTFAYLDTTGIEVPCTVIAKRQAGPAHTVYLCQRHSDGYRFAAIQHAANPGSIVLWHASYADAPTGEEDYVLAIRPRGERYLRRKLASALAAIVLALAVVAPSARAVEVDPAAFAYMATYVTYDANGDAQIDVADSGLSQQDCAAWLLTAPAPERYSDGALTAAECMLDVGD